MISKTVLPTKFRFIRIICFYFPLLVLSISANAFAPGVPVNLSQIASNNDVFGSFKLSPDGKVVVYRARSEQSGDLDLYSVPVAGGEPINLTADIPGDASFLFAISNDSSKIVYTHVDPQNELSLRLASVPSSTGVFVSKVLSGNLVNTPTRINNFLISADSSHVVYSARTSFAPRYRLYSMPLVAPIPDEPTIIAGRNSGPNQNIFAFQFVPNQNRIVYLGDLDEQGKFELYAGPSDTHREGEKLNVTLASGRNVSEFDVSPDGNYVVYIADARVVGLNELYSTSLLVPEFNKLNPNTIASTEDIFNFKISPNSQHVVYLSNERNVAIDELFSVPINDNGGGRSTRISTDLPQDGDVRQNYEISPNSARVVYLADVVDERFQLFSTLISSKSTTTLTPNIGINEAVQNFSFNKSGAHVVYQLVNTESIPSVTNIYSVRVTGGENISLSATDSGNFIGSRTVHPELDRVFYLSDQRHDSLFELFSSKVTGPSGSSRLLNTPLSPLSSYEGVLQFTVSNDGKYLVYLADQDIAGKRELYSVELDASSICFPIKARNSNVAMICL